MFDRYQTLRRELFGKRASEFMRAFPLLAEEFKRFKIRRLEEARELAPDFNIFRVMGVERDEVRLHSAMLAHLLDARASHGQRSLFMRGFLTMLSEKLGRTLDKELFRRGWSVRTEVVIPSTNPNVSIGRRLDIVLSSRERGCLVVIENKIDADEQYDQLKDYRAWMEKQRGTYSERILVFLTLDGRNPKSDEPTEILNLSYREDVVTWLSDCLKEILAPRVREIVQQYLGTIRNI